MMSYKVVVPNLDRRPDRWCWCSENLMNQGVPRENIERFSAFDVLEFRGLLGWKDKLRESIHKQFGAIPFWLDCWRRDGDWVWARTWYTIIKRIAEGTDAVLLLVDDKSVSYTYGEICNHLNILKKQQSALAMIQYTCHSRGWVQTLKITERLENIPEMQYGLHGGGEIDSGMLFTPHGANRILEFLDVPSIDEDKLLIHVQKGEYTPLYNLRRRGHSEAAMWAFSFSKDVRGCYSAVMPGNAQQIEQEDYLVNREDRVLPPKRWAEKFELGQIALLKVFDSHEKYTFNFYVRKEGYLELASIVHPAMMFQNYGYRSSLLSDNHIEERRKRGKENFAKMNNVVAKSVCEIACNDGYMLNRYAEEGVKKVVGVEPAVNLHQYIHPGVHVYPDFFNHKVARKIVKEHGRFDIVHAHNVLAHTPDPVGMLMGFSELMHETSVLVLEFEYLIDMLEKVQFYHMYHEHYFYFGLGGIMEFLKCVPPLHIMKAERVEAQGGSILCALTKSEKHEDDEILKNLLKSEREYLKRPGVIDDFVANTERQLKSFVEYINAQPIDSVQGLFANAKAVVILNLALSHGLELDRFRGFYDDAEELQGNKLPGTAIEIFPTSEMSDPNEYCTVLFAPNLTELAREKYGVNTVNVKGVLEGAI